MGANACAGGLLDTADCNFHPALATGAAGIVHATVSCPCASVPDEETTWGGVKALYAE